MRRLEVKLKKYLEARYVLLEQMKSVLAEQERFLIAGDIFGCTEKCGRVDEIVASFKAQDYEIARLELLSDDLDVVGIVTNDSELRNLVRKAVGITAQNAALVDGLAESLSKSRELLEQKRTKTAAGCSTSA
jgi:hypothetical protein